MTSYSFAVCLKIPSSPWKVCLERLFLGVLLSYITFFLICIFNSARQASPFRFVLTFPMTTHKMKLYNFFLTLAFLFYYVPISNTQTHNSYTIANITAQAICTPDGWICLNAKQKASVILATLYEWPPLQQCCTRIPTMHFKFKPIGLSQLQ